MTELIAVVEKSKRERIHVSIEVFKGRRFVDLRIFYEIEGEWRPSRKGVALKPEIVEQVIDALELADIRARLLL